MLFKLVASLKFIIECLLVPCTVLGTWNMLLNENIPLSLWNFSYGLRGRQERGIKNNIKASYILIV